MDERIFSVSELIDFVNGSLAEEVIVEGEISRLDIRQGNLVFITLVDQTSAIDVFGLVFRLRNISELSEGMLVRVYGTPGLYKKSGRFRIDANAILPSGDGALRLAFERLKHKLETEGLFDTERKRRIVRFPEKIALITAPKSQAYNDFIKVLRERFGGIRIDFYPVKVQGIGAEKTIANALAATSETSYDAVVLIRGGGSLEDLAAFNSEEVARAVFSSGHPIIVGVGHEGDISLADFVADLRASTPSNAAELLVPERNAVQQEIDYTIAHLEQQLIIEIQNARHTIHQSILRAKHAVTEALETFKTTDMQLAQWHTSLRLGIQQQRSEIQQTQQRIVQAVHNQTKNLKLSISALDRVVLSAHPKNVLARGYSILTKENGTIVTDASRVARGSVLRAQLSHGTLNTRVESYESKSKKDFF